MFVGTIGPKSFREKGLGDFFGVGRNKEKVHRRFTLVSSADTPGYGTGQWYALYRDCSCLICGDTEATNDLALHNTVFMSALQGLIFG